MKKLTEAFEIKENQISSLVTDYDTFKNKTLLNELRNKNNVEFVLNSTINKIIGDNHVEKLELINNNNESKTISVNGLFIAIGQEPKNEIFANIVELDQKGYIKTIEDVKTKSNGIYVAGDTRVKELRQLTTAVSDGAIAASIAIKEMK